MPESVFRSLLIRVATDPRFAAQVRADPDLPAAGFGLTKAEAGVIAAAAMDHRLDQGIDPDGTRIS
jgi:hypothetical protein